MTGGPLERRMTCRTTCIESGRWRGAVRQRLRQAMVDGAMQRLEDFEAEPARFMGPGRVAIPPSAVWRDQALVGAREKASKCGFVPLWVWLGMKLFELFILPQILDWWKNRHSGEPTGQGVGSV